MQSLTKNRGTVTIKFRTEKDRVNGVYELYNSTTRSSSIGKHGYVVTQEHLDIFERKDIKYNIIK
jgi:hypothetical protein